MFSRRALLSAFPSLAFLPEKSKERRLSTLRRDTSKTEEEPEAFPPVYPLVFTETMHDVLVGENVVHHCNGKTRTIGAALVDAKKGEHLAVVVLSYDLSKTLDD